MSRHVFCDRLELEEKVFIGIRRLLLFSMMFALIILSNNLGVPASEKFAVSTLLEGSLDLETLREIKNLNSLRDFLPVISDRIKQFSASSSNRFSISDGEALLANSRSFESPLPLITVDLDITQSSFTIAAWVQKTIARLPSGVTTQAIIRKPMKSNRDLSCWGWFYPATFRYGAHDFHSVDDNPDTWEEVVTVSDGEMPSGVLTHEVVIVENQTVTYYRDGILLGSPQRLPRSITDCRNPAPVELGTAGLALSSVKFYPRALLASEVNEIFTAGQPLAEVATGSKLSAVDEDAFEQLRGSVDTGNEKVEASMDEFAEREMVIASVLGITSARYGQEIEDTLYPPDPAPTAYLPKGEAVFLEVDKHGETLTLPDMEMEKWVAGGKPTDGFQVNAWKDLGDGLGTFWSVFEAPMYADGTGFPLPEFKQENETGITVSCWYKPFVQEMGYGPDIRLVNDGGVMISMRVQLDWVTIEMEVDDDKPGIAWRFLTNYDPATGKIMEKFLLSAFAQEAEPMVWRHLVYQWRPHTCSMAFFLDGKLVYDTKDTMPQFDAATLQKAYTRIWTNGTIWPHSWARGSDYKMIPGKTGQFRVYPRQLSDLEIEQLHEESMWPPTPSYPYERAVRQCADSTIDLTFHDTIDVDEKGHHCAWYARIASEHPYVCSAKWLKNMCPLTCNGKRICHDGTLKYGFEAKARRRKFRVFDRIMHLKPKDGAKSLLCPSDRVKREELVESCRKYKQMDEEMEGDFYNGEWARNFSWFLGKSYPGVSRTDLRDCDALAASIDETQCAWNSSWLDDFREDYEETGTWAMTIWVRSKQGSFGMPSNFWYGLFMYSTLSPPLTLAHFNEPYPQYEPWMDVYATTLQKSTNLTKTPRCEVFPTTLVKYQSEWTMMHVQLERLKDGSHRMCATLNAIPLNCETRFGGESLGPSMFPADSFLQAIEFTTEMMVSPIEVTTEAYTPAEIQEKYYSKVARMKTILGPDVPETQRLEEKKIQTVKKTQLYDQRMALVAPPLLFQQRAGGGSCESDVSSPFLQAQLDLMRAAHCINAVCPNATNLNTVVTCHDGEENQDFFGLSRSMLGGNEGYAEFLYSIADSDVLVRDGKTLVARNFLDGQTRTALILAVFHVPSSGLTTELEITFDLSGIGVSTEINFLHYGYMRAESMPTALLIYAILFMLIFLVVVMNGWEYVLLRREFLSRKIFNRTAMLEVAYDIFQAFIVTAYASITFHTTRWSEYNARSILSDFASVPFAQSNTALTEKVDKFFQAVDNFNETLDYEGQIATLAFVIMVLMLVRIIAATAVHPRTGVLTGTLIKSLNDLWHFTILFMLVFICFALAANLIFGDRGDFADLETSMQTQFLILLGELPDSYTQDDRMITYVVLTNVVMFLLMLNFLLAIIVEGYTQVRQDILENESENEFCHDVVLSIYGEIMGAIQGWPQKRDVAFVLRHYVGSRKISPLHMLRQGWDYGVVRMFKHYHNMPDLACSPPAWLRPETKYEKALKTIQSVREASNLQSLQSGAGSSLRAVAPALLPPPNEEQNPVLGNGTGAGAGTGTGNGNGNGHVVTKPVEPSTDTFPATREGRSGNVDTDPRFERDVRRLLSSINKRLTGMDDLSLTVHTMKEQLDDVTREVERLTNRLTYREGEEEGEEEEEEDERNLEDRKSVV